MPPDALTVALYVVPWSPAFREAGATAKVGALTLMDTVAALEVPVALVAV